MKVKNLVLNQYYDLSKITKNQPKAYKVMGTNLLKDKEAVKIKIMGITKTPPANHVATLQDLPFFDLEYTFEVCRLNSNKIKRYQSFRYTVMNDNIIQTPYRNKRLFKTLASKLLFCDVSQLRLLAPNDFDNACFLEAL